MKFLIQHNLMNEGQLNLTADAVKPFPHEFVGLIPFSHEITSNEPIEGVDYIPYGSTLLTNLAYDRGWTGLHFDLDKFNYTAAIENRSDMLNGGTILPAWKMIENLKYDDLDMQIFMRPSEDLKHFSGAVDTARNFVEMLEDMIGVWESGDVGSYALNPDTDIVVAKTQKISAEWRWFIVGGKIISGSMYRAHGQLRKLRELDKAVIDEAQALADIWLPDDCVVMDTALVGDEIKVIEFNCINSSGFYDNDVPAIFKALWDYHDTSRS